METSNSSFCSMCKLMRKAKFGLLIVSVVGLLIISCFVYINGIGSVSKNSDKKEFIIEPGSSYLTIASNLKENNLIKSELFYKIYIKLNNPEPVQAGKYYLSENMSVNEIVNALSKGSTYNPDVITITFKEGIHMREIAKVIAQNTNNTVDDIFKTLKDQSYLNELINKYWFISDEIKNQSIYYSLEGYLFPDTYQFRNKDVTVKEIFETLLNQMANKLEPYKKSIEDSKYSIHEILTMASIVELESSNSNDRAGVAGVFYNRLVSGWSLGSDVTTYYAEQIDMNERDLYQSELDSYNAYNTRSSKMAGRLPVGPICIPSINSIVASINYTNHNYYFFVADKNQKTYFTKTNAEHVALVNDLRKQGLWYEY
ncbi:MAG: endolytic transglycosylase MltG [Firmicutes bacterium]|nr:endolytic transglycosylase MltG [Bacillota bacterium]